MFDKNIEQNQIITFSLLIIAIVSSAFALYYARSVLVPFVLALFLRFLIAPLIDFQIYKLKVHRYVAIPIAILVVVYFFIFLIPPLFNSIKSFLENASDYQDKVILLVDFVLKWIQQQLNIEIDIFTIEESLRELPFLDWSSDLLAHTAHFIESFFIILVILLFLIIGETNKEKTLTWNTMDNSIKKYISAKVLVAFGTSILFFITYWLLDLELAIIFAILTFFLTFIPIFGAAIAVILPIPVAFIQYDTLLPIILIILLPLSYKIIIGDFIEPRIIGSALNLHAVTIVLALIFWGLLWGAIGVLLAAPITAIIKISFEQYNTTKPIARLLEGKIHHKN
ncbi:MAG: hypothetical protein CL723_02495 [Chloroflexi bacterium]|nr:hypothetical protein [Chloroflexota bacterium]